MAPSWWKKDRKPSTSSHGKTLTFSFWGFEKLENRCLPSLGLLGSFTGIDANNAGAALEPPDTYVAAGPAYLVETVNVSMAIYSKVSGAQVQLHNLSIFFSPVGAGNVNDTYDPGVT